MNNEPGYRHLTSYVRPENYVGAEWHGYYTVAGRNRDSDILTNSNFDCWVKFMTALSGPADTVVGKEDEPRQTGMFKCDGETDDIVNWTICKENHWACGWIELIRVHESVGHEKLLAIDAQLHRLDGYPVFDETAFTQAEDDEYRRCWEHAGAKEDFIREIRRQFKEASEDDTNGTRDEMTELLDRLDEVPLDDLIGMHERMIPSGEYHHDGWPCIDLSVKAMDWEDLEEVVEKANAAGMKHGADGQEL